MKSLVATCMRISTHFAAIAADFEELEKSAGIMVPTLQTHEQQVGPASSVLERRKKMETTTTATATQPRRELMSAKQIAELLTIDVRSFRRLKANRAEKFPLPIRIGSSKRWREREVREWLDSRRPE